ncbi:MAG TPA: hypothetical protein VGJ20_21585 [Xanthobacteraceae bacterium]
MPAAFEHETSARAKLGDREDPQSGNAADVDLLNGLLATDVLVLTDPLGLMHRRTLKMDLSRVGVFNPTGQIGMHHGKPPV